MREVYSPAEKGFKGSQQPEAWHLDKKVPVAIIIALGIQFVGAIWWAAKMDARDGEQERRIGAIEVWQDGTQQQLQTMSERLARIDERLQLQVDLLKDIRNRVGAR